jgi:hypothetical protein
MRTKPTSSKVQRWALLAALVVGMICGLARRPCHEARVARGVKRRVAPMPDAIRARLTNTGGLAQAASLWGDGPLSPCRVPAQWGNTPGSAHFAAVMCMAGPMTLHRTAYRPLAGALAHVSVRRFVRIETGGASIVRLVSAGPFKPKRALYGAVSLQAAA